MIIGIGIDIEENDRIRKEISLYGDRFLNEIFTANELSGDRDAGHLTGVFAAKEAFIKSIGVKLVFKDMEISYNINGRPIISTTGMAEKILKDVGVSNVFVSISHSQMYSTAVVLLES